MTALPQKRLFWLCRSQNWDMDDCYTKAWLDICQAKVEDVNTSTPSGFDYLPLWMLTGLRPAAKNHNHSGLWVWEISCSDPAGNGKKIIRLPLKYKTRKVWSMEKQYPAILLQTVKSIKFSISVDFSLPLAPHGTLKSCEISFWESFQ